MQNSSAKLDELQPERFLDSRPVQLARFLLGFAWDVMRLPVLTLLTILEPLVQFFLSASALLLALTAIFFKFVVHRPNFPFWTMVALAIGCVWALALYYAIIRVLCVRGTVGPVNR